MAIRERQKQDMNERDMAISLAGRGEVMLREAITLAGQYRDRCNEAAAFLDGLASKLEQPDMRVMMHPDAAATDCRAMARKLRGET